MTPGTRLRATPAIVRAIEGVAALCAGPFEGRVHIVSKAGPKIAALTREWLARTKFFDITGVSASNVWFVRKRVDKGPLCDELGVSHFVDDRLDVLGHLTSVAHRYLFLGGLGQNPRPSSVPKEYGPFERWPDLAAAIHHSLKTNF